MKDMKGWMGKRNAETHGKMWIQGAIKHPGALTETAKKGGGMGKGGKIKGEWLAKKAKGIGVTARRARLAMTLKKLRKG